MENEGGNRRNMMLMVLHKLHDERMKDHIICCRDMHIAVKNMQSEHEVTAHLLRRLAPFVPTLNIYRRITLLLV